jgi:uncharacterized membrane protein
MYATSGARPESPRHPSLRGDARSIENYFIIMIQWIIRFDGFHFFLLLLLFSSLSKQNEKKRKNRKKPNREKTEKRKGGEKSENCQLTPGS